MNDRASWILNNRKRGLEIFLQLLGIRKNWLRLWSISQLQALQVHSLITITVPKVG